MNRHTLRQPEHSELHFVLVGLAFAQHAHLSDTNRGSQGRGRDQLPQPSHHTLHRKKLYLTPQMPQKLTDEAC